ncbi:MAG: hypothetical protein EOP20_06655, partial [Hyphomicrobiales bacterium]
MKAGVLALGAAALILPLAIAAAPKQKVEGLQPVSAFAGIADKDARAVAIFQEMGKVIYCQYLELINELLFTRYLRPIRFTFLGQHGFTHAFFNEHIKAAIKDLGPRFNAELNFKLPVAKLFNDLAKDELFKKKLLGGFHKWLVKN